MQYSILKSKTNTLHFSDPIENIIKTQNLIKTLYINICFVFLKLREKNYKNVYEFVNSICHTSDL